MTHCLAINLSRSSIYEIDRLFTECDSPLLNMSPISRITRLTRDNGEVRYP